MLLVWMSDNQATGEEDARHFLSTNKEIWIDEVAFKRIVSPENFQEWVSAEASAKIEVAL